MKYKIIMGDSCHQWYLLYGNKTDKTNSSFADFVKSKMKFQIKE